MRKHRLVIASSIALVCSLILPVSNSLAQQAPSRVSVSVRKVDGVKTTTPVYTVKATTLGGRAKDWFRAYIEYDTETEWTDELTFTFYVRVKGKSRDVPPFTLFKGETSYIHIPLGSRHIADMFIHPNFLSRYGDVDAVAVEVRSGGRVLARDGKPKPADAWWEKFSPVDGVLLNRSQTPFAFVDFDSYEIIKPK